MDRVRVKSPAKLNLTLEIAGAEGGYHMLDSVVTTIDLFDVVTVKRRGDGRVTISMRGLGSENIPPEKNNAARAAELFSKKFGTCGADIFIDKNIPMGAGLGGSSADAAGVLNAMCSLYGVKNAAAEEIADMVGSDTRFMMRGGWARMRGRGNIVESFQSALKLNFFIIAPQSGVSAAECYKLYDELPDGRRANTQRALGALASGDYAGLCGSLYNALYAPARRLNPDAERALYEAFSFSPDGACMTGSGSAAFAVFENEQLCRWAKSRYRGSFYAFCAKTYIPRPLKEQTDG